MSTVELEAPNRPQQQAWAALLERSSAPYRRHGRFAWHFARGKLGRDPIFRNLLAKGLLQPPSRPALLRVCDIGCGQGLLASLVHQTQQAHVQGEWPAQWPAPAASFSYHGIELMQRDVDRAMQSLAPLNLDARLVCGDMRLEPLPPCDLVVIFDVLHYVDHDAQDALLARVRQALAPGGRLLLRVGDMAQASGFAASQWVDRIVTFIRGHRAPPTWGRPLQAWLQRLESMGFEVESLPMSQGTPFANVLLVADLPPGAPATS